MPRMVHSKVVVIDHRFSDVGSANFTSLSHGVYDEINLYADSESFALALEAEIASHCAGARSEFFTGAAPLRAPAATVRFQLVVVSSLLNRLKAPAALRAPAHRR